MRQSELFTKTRKEAPKDEVAKNAILLLRAGFVHKEMAGVYSYLPLGLRVLNKIARIIREEMNGIGGQEVFLTALQDSSVWAKSGRWQDDAITVWFKTKLKKGAEIGLANTHEEPLANLLTEHISSYKDLPKYIYQIQTKFRNEARATSGLMRGREFLMKDMYSFVRSEDELDAFHEKCAASYMKIFKRSGLGDITYRTYSSGGTFSRFSDEFQTLSEAGEDTIYLDEKKKIAVNKEVYEDSVLKELGLKKDALKEARAIEVGNIFKLGTKFSKAEGLEYLDEKGEKHPVIMGSYGIGVGRLMGAVVETHCDERGIVWPEEISPFTAHLIALKGGEEQADAVYEFLSKEGVEVLYDDREDLSAGEKLADADLMGITYRVISSSKTFAENKVEIKKRSEERERLVDLKELADYVK